MTPMALDGPDGPDGGDPTRREALEIAPEARPPEEPEGGGLWQRLRRGLTMTHTELIEKMGAASPF